MIVVYTFSVKIDIRAHQWYARRMNFKNRYVALLRGVNVGGKNRVPKAEFRTVLESLGFSDVVIYINSGNAVFSSDTLPDTSAV